MHLLVKFFFSQLPQAVEVLKNYPSKALAYFEIQQSCMNFIVILNFYTIVRYISTNSCGVASDAHVGPL
jgi:hypothetical protein